ncbi:MAG: NADH-dependent phenylglyoxylate dehydrogenase subunit epsilon [Dehalococcoidia bacterium]|nr:NADH-dependent phenylglyoxylate dehydrogenase subunit epsilon [Bacillota bacterium]MBT9141657.1 NADH-dependent phenylglyoxylate dehydrogenase subunit epsilon [Bacillota bacterium]
MLYYLIIGASAAGVAAAETLCQVDPRSQVTILCKESTRPYSRVLLPYLLTGAVEEETIFLSVPEEVKLLTGKEVVRVQPQRREVAVSTGEVFPFDKLLIASGASPVRSKVEGADLPFVFTVRELSDIQGMREWIETGKRAVIVGGGLVSMRIGEALHRLGMRVTFVIGSDRVLSQILDAPASAIVEQVLVERGIEIIKEDEIVQIAEGETHLRSGKRRECTLVAFGKGVRPNVSFLEGSGIETASGIIVDEHQRTNVADIYAAGDVAETLDIAYEERRINALWPVAREQGHIAALNMASLPAIYDGSVARNTLEVFDLPIFTAGMGREEGPEVLREHGKGFYHKLVLDNGMLKGAISVGRVRDEGLYLFLIRRRGGVSSFVDRLLRGTFSYPLLIHRWWFPLE